MTSTHGSGVKYAPLCDFVHAVRMIAGDGKEYVFEKKTGARFQPGDFGDGVTLVQDDHEFLDAVVQIGTAGIVTQILYELVDYFYIRQTRTLEPWSTFKPKVYTRGPHTVPAHPLQRVHSSHCGA